MLTAYPCADKHNDVLVKSPQSQTNSQHNHSHEEKTDLCSPFEEIHWKPNMKFHK